MNIIFQMILMALLAVLIYVIIGFIPGTDETSVLMPITLVIILAGVPPIAVLSFFISAIVTLNLTNAIPTVLVGLPGGVMSSPLLEDSLYLKSKGMSTILIKKMAAGSLLGVLIAVPLSLVLANLLAPLGPFLSSKSALLLFLGAIFLSLLSKNKILSLVSIVPMSILFMSLRHLYWGIGAVAPGVNISTSFFLGITIGPLFIELLGLLNKAKVSEMIVEGKNEITINIDTKSDRSVNPFKIMTKEEIKNATIGSILVNFLFVLSPVGLTILFGESLSRKIKDPITKALNSIVTKSALVQATYISGIIIPLIAVGIPLSPVSIGPGGALFEALPVLSLDNNIHHLLSNTEFVIAVLIGSIVAISITYFIVSKYASTMAAFVLTRFPHEAILGLFISFVVLLAYMDAGLINVFGVLLIGICSGTLNKMGVNYGVQFMTLYASPFVINLLGSL